MNKFIEIIHKKGKFKLHSGEISSDFYDVLEIITDYNFIIQFRQFIKEVPFLVGIEFGGSLLASLSEKPFAIIRKDNTIYGTIPYGYYLIDDVVTTGQSIIDTIKLLEPRVCMGIYCIIDRRTFDTSDVRENSFKSKSMYKINR